MIKPISPEAFVDLVAAVFNQPEGQSLLDQLILRECCRTVAPENTDSLLRHNEGRRELIIELANIAGGHGTERESE